MQPVRHQTATVDGHAVFYRESGPVDGPVVVLLHGFPTSSHMFRGLIPALSDSYRTIAPDYLGFGLSDAPSVEEFDYSFDALADTVDGLLNQLGIKHFTMYVQDYGAPVGWRLALRHPKDVDAIISQNGNAYTEGLVDAFWSPLTAYAFNPGPDTEGPPRYALSMEGIRWQYLNGVPEPALVSPDTWMHDHAMVQRPGNDRIQLQLFRDYGTNITMYPRVQDYFRTSRVPLMAVWGANDPIFGPEGARCFSRDLPDAEVHLLDTGHFALESHLDTIAGYVRGFLGRVIHRET